jgi:hypothetical protein
MNLDIQLICIVVGVVVSVLTLAIGLGFLMLSGQISREDEQYGRGEQYNRGDSQ